MMVIYLQEGLNNLLFVISLYTVNETNLDLSYLSHDLLKEEEVKPKLKVLNKNGLSQTEKFNLRWKH